MQKKFGIKFSGIGAALPSKTVKNTDLEKLFDTTDEWIYTRTGIKERRILNDNETGLSLSVDASKEALKNASINAGDLDLIIVCTSTPDNLYPSMACLLQGHLGAKKAVGFDLSAACSGFVFGLVTAAQYIYSGVYKKILIVGVDIHSRFLNWSDRNISILFGDGAGAIVLDSTAAENDDLKGFAIHSEADMNSDLVLTNNNTSYSNFSKTVNSNFVCMNGKAVYQFAVQTIPEVVNEILSSSKMNINDIDYFVPHQANKRIIDASAKKLGFGEEKIICNIEKVGNTSAASIPLALYDGLKNGKIKTPSKLILVGFGAGLTWGGAVVNFGLKL